MYQSHLLQSVEAADRMREAQARLQREIGDETAKLHWQATASRNVTGLFVPFRILTGRVTRAPAGSSTR